MASIRTGFDWHHGVRRRRQIMGGKNLKFNSITWKMIRVLILIILPFNLVTIITAALSMEKAKEQTLTTIQNMSQLSMQQLDARISATNNLFYNIENDREDYKLYAKQGERTLEVVLAETKLAHYFSNCTSNQALADCIFWQSDAYNSIYISMEDIDGLDTKVEQSIKQDLSRMLAEKEECAYTNWDYIEINNSMWIIKTYEENGLYYGGMFSLDGVKADLLKVSSLESLDIYFSTKDEQLQVQKKYMATEALARGADLKMQLLIPKSVSYSNLSRIQILCCIFVFLYVLLIPVLMVIMNGMMLKPLREIHHAMDKLKDGNQDYRIPLYKHADEFEAIDRAFNDMADKIHTLKIENYEKELEKQKMELKTLQLQIRPHFLMNMFNLLYSFAQIENYQSIQKLSLYLSDYFRCIFQSGKDRHPFRQEYQLIQKYLEISKLRYPHWYESVCNVDEDVLDVEVPPLLIHNFIENIIKHVIRFEQIVHIRLEAFTSEEEATFIIVDDGPEMDVGIVDQINSGRFKYNEKEHVHVGIENSYRRMHSIYGDKGQILVDSIKGQGTCITIIIPKGKEV